MNRHFWQRCAACGLIIAVLASSGCSIFPEAMQPENWGRLNHNAPPSSESDPFLSVLDPEASLIKPE